MSIRLLTAAALLLTAGLAQAKPPEVPVPETIDCTPEPAPPAEGYPQATVGQIKIVGNTVTPADVIRTQLTIYPGQVLRYPDLLKSAENLVRLHIFEVDEATGARPRVEVIDPDSDNPVKDILVNVQEMRTGSLLFGIGVNSDAGLTDSVVLHQEPELPIDLLPFVATTEAPAFSWHDVMLDVMMPPLRLRHFCPAKARLTVHELKPQMCFAVEMCQDMVAQYFATPIPVDCDAEPDCAVMPPGDECWDVDTAACEESEVSIIVRNKATGEVISSRQQSFCGATGLRVCVTPIECGAVEPEQLEVIPHDVESIGFMPREVDDDPCTEEAEPIEAMPQEVPAKPEACHPPACGFCPRGVPAGATSHPCDPEAASPERVLENIEKLFKARRAFQRADRFRESGDFERACKYYRKAAAYCPGSRYETEAWARIEEMAADKPKDGETEDADVQPPANGDLSHLGKDAKYVYMLARLIDRKYAAIKPGKNAKCVRMMARFIDEEYAAFKNDFPASLEAMIRCTGPCTACRPWVQFSRVIAVMPPMAPDCYPGCRTDSGADAEEAMPVDEEPEPLGPPCGAVQPDQVNLHPCLPPVDASVVKALDKLLQCKDGVQETPNLLVDPIDTDLELQEEGGTESSAPLHRQFGDIIDALHGGLSLDVDGLDGDSSHLRISVKLGVVRCKVVMDESGQRSFIVSLSKPLTEHVRNWFESKDRGSEEDAEDANDNMYCPNWQYDK